MTHFHHDQPIHSEDQDQLNRYQFAKHLTDTLIQDIHSECFTVSLEGEWGFGKTSVINLVKAAAEQKKPKPIIVEYNPWLAGQPDALIQDFLLQFAAQLNIKSKAKNAISAGKQLIAYASLFNVAKLVPGAEPWASIVEKVTSSTGEASKAIGELKALDLLAQKQQVANAIAKLKRPILVIIDDIDRLTPAETFQILRLTKAVADFSGTTFLLAFDPQYLTAVLAKNHIDNTAQYIDKVIQLRVPLPQISPADIKKIADAELSTMDIKQLTAYFPEDDVDFDDFYTFDFKSLMQNPRELKRFFNHLRFVVAQVQGQVRFSDLFILSLLAIKASAIYEHIKSCPDVYIGRVFRNGSHSKDEIKKEIISHLKEHNSILANFNSRDRHNISRLISLLFPMMHNESFADIDFDTQGSIANYQRLHIALHYQLPSDYISDQAVTDFITNRTDRKQLLNKTILNNQITRFLELLQLYLNKNQHYTLNTLQALFDEYFNLISNKSDTALSSDKHFEELYDIAYTANAIVLKNNKPYQLLQQLITKSTNALFLFENFEGLIRKLGNLTENQQMELKEKFANSAYRLMISQQISSINAEQELFNALLKISKQHWANYVRESLDNNNIIHLLKLIARTYLTNIELTRKNDSISEIKFIDFGHYYNHLPWGTLTRVAQALDPATIKAQPAYIQTAIASIIDGTAHAIHLSEDDSP